MPGRPPSLRAIAAFEAAARHQSFAKAADELNLTHGAISHAIRSLEERLGNELFDRQGRGVSLTDAGRVLAGRVRLGIGLLSDAFDTRPWIERSRLVVSTLPGFATRFLAPRVHRFRERHPDIDLEIGSSWSLAPIGDRRIDIGLRYGPGGWAGLSAVQLAEEYIFPVVSPNYPRPLPKTPEELLDHELIGHPYFPWRLWFAEAGLSVNEPKTALTVDDSALVLDVAAAGAGIALGRSLLVQGDLASGRLERLFDIQAKADYSYWMVWNPVSPKLGNIELFRAWLADELAEFAGFAVTAPGPHSQAA
ncbi:MAG TPA: LysR substrate-binding domain-containing protein [Sphingomicrobium sp.]